MHGSFFFLNKMHAFFLNVQFTSEHSFGSDFTIIVSKIIGLPRIQEASLFYKILSGFE